MTTVLVVGAFAAAPATATTAAAAEPVAAPQIEVVDLGRPGGATYSTANLVNDHGVVAGSGFLPAPSIGVVGFVWRNGRFDLIPDGSVVALNERGQVAGNLNTETRHEAFLWSNGRTRPLGFVGGPVGSRTSHAEDINAAGVVVGNSTVDSGEHHAAMWSRGRASDLGTLGGDFSSANAVNDRGQVVGQSYTASGSAHPFLWENGRMVDLGSLGGGFGTAVDVNNRGQVVGVSQTSSGAFHAFLWECGRMTDLNAVNNADGDAVAINDLGHVLVRGGTANSFVWKAGRAYDLVGLGGSFLYPVALNSRGEVAGSAGLPDGTEHATLWSADGAVTDLGLSQADGLNATGLVVGNTRLPGASVENATLWRVGRH